MRFALASVFLLAQHGWAASALGGLRSHSGAEGQDPEQARVKNAELKKTLEQRRGVLEGLEGEEETLLDQIVAHMAERTETMNAFDKERKDLQASLRDAKSAHMLKQMECDRSYVVNHAKLASKVIGAISLSQRDTRVRVEPEIPQILAENKLLLGELEKLNWAIAHKGDRIPLHEASLLRNGLSVEEMEAIVNSMREAYKLQEETYTMEIKLLDNRCAEADLINTPEIQDAILNHLVANEQLSELTTSSTTTSPSMDAKQNPTKKETKWWARVTNEVSSWFCDTPRCT